MEQLITAYATAAKSAPTALTLWSAVALVLGGIAGTVMATPAHIRAAGRKVGERLEWAMLWAIKAITEAEPTVYSATAAPGLYTLRIGSTCQRFGSAVQMMLYAYRPVARAVQWLPWVSTVYRTNGTWAIGERWQGGRFVGDTRMDLLVGALTAPVDWDNGTLTIRFW